MAYEPLSSIMVTNAWVREKQLTEDCYKCSFCGRKFLFREAYFEHIFTCEERQKILYPEKKVESTIQVSILEF
jgi:hypothetical protein